MTCDDYRSLMDVPRRLTVAEISAAANHRCSCSGCREWLDDKVREELETMTPEELALATAKGIRAGAEAALKAFDDPEIDKELDFG